MANIYCMNCGTKAPSGLVNFCPKCGTSLNGGIPPHQKTIKTSISVVHEDTDETEVDLASIDLEKVRAGISVERPPETPKVTIGSIVSGATPVDDKPASRPKAPKVSRKEFMAQYANELKSTKNTPKEIGG